VDLSALTLASEGLATADLSRQSCQRRRIFDIAVKKRKPGICQPGQQDFVRIRLKPSSAHCPLTNCQLEISAFAIGDCWRLLAIFFHKPKSPIESDWESESNSVKVSQSSFTGTRRAAQTGKLPNEPKPED
jgi:hypothetical protein